MTNLSNIVSCKQSLDNAIHQYVETLKSTAEWVKLMAKCAEFENGAYDKTNEFVFDNCYLLNSRIQTYIPAEWHNEDLDILDAIKDALSKEFECLYFSINRDDSMLTIEQCLGEATTINHSAYGGQYYIHSSELGLELERNDVQSDEHGLYLIECAMRKAGIFGNIVEVDSYGYLIKFTDTGLGGMSDDELAKYGEQFN